jgi:hypothetical protein
MKGGFGMFTKPFDEGDASMCSFDVVSISFTLQVVNQLLKNGG